LADADRSQRHAVIRRRGVDRAAHVADEAPQDVRPPRAFGFDRLLQPPLHDVSASLTICQKAIVALLQ
jgi:hypothetical protein